jgi:type I restriction enzyme S subunit
MNWQEYGIDEVCELIVDCVNRTAPVVDYETPYKMIRTSNVRDGWIDMSDARNVTKDTYEKWTRRAVPRQGDVVLTREAPLGEVGLIRTDEPVFLGQRTVMYRTNPEKILPHFLYYSLLNHDVQAQIQAFGFGSTVSHMRVPDAKKLQLRVPDTVTQEKIIFVIDAYDTIIEANKRRIQLLEESARLLYREWFVKLRFPGHEIVPVTDGVPEGWNKLNLSELADVIMGQSPESKHFNEEGEGAPFHQGVSDFGDRFVTHSTFSTHATRIALPGDILCSVRAPVGRLNVTLDKIVIGRGLSAIRSKTNSQSLLFYQLKNLFFQEDLIGGGAIFASVGKKELFGQELLQPSEEVASTFERFASGIDQQIGALTLQIRHLQEARDMLLPRLMSGALDVSRIALPKEVEA